VGKQFPLCVKLNSADFQQGGFELADCRQVAHWLEQEGIDLLEVSGGTYESLVWMDNSEQRESTRQREAYFLEYAQAIREVTRTPLMITGGFRHAQTMARALASGATDMIGLARPFCVDPDFPRHLLDGTLTEAPQGERGLVLGKGWLGPRSPVKTIRALNNQGQVAWFYQQILRLARQQPTLTRKSVLANFLRHAGNEIRINKRRQFNA
jgi:tRNA-dihydrouridine synthase